MLRKNVVRAVIGCGVALACAIAPWAPVRAADTTFLRATVASAAQAAGVDPTEVFALEITVDRLDGGTVTTTVGELVDEFDGTAGTRESGILGTPEVMVGDTVHAYVSAGRGDQLGYTVTESAVAPSTPPVFLPPPATGLAFDVGGTTKNIKGSYQAGLHTAGTVVGSNVDTNSPAPNGDPVWLPVRSGGTISDTSIDFVGHAVVVQAQACLFGFCIAVGGFVGTGVAVFDSTLPVGLPTIP